LTGVEEGSRRARLREARRLAPRACHGAQGSTSSCATCRAAVRGDDDSN